MSDLIRQDMSGVRIGRFHPPTRAELEEWLDEGRAEALDGCVVEPDGTCPHGSPSWLIELGLI